jgi:hypothetical protein
MILHKKKCLFYQYILGSLEFYSTNDLPDSTSSQAALHSQGAMCHSADFARVTIFCSIGL